MIVADTGPVIAFARIGRLDLLHQVAGDLVIPDAVFEELVGGGRPRPGADEVTQAEWIHRSSVADRAAVAALPPALHAGEQEAIVLAQDLQVRLLIDERRGRSIAEARGQEVVGSLGILAEAKQQGVIDQASPLVERMLATGYWIDEDLLPVFFREVGEE